MSEKERIELIRKYLDILEEHYNITSNQDFEVDGLEYICVEMPDEVESIAYKQDQFLDYMSDISSFRKINNSTVRTKHVRQTIIDTPRHGSEYIEKRLMQYAYRGNNYEVRVVNQPFLIGLCNSKEQNCDDNYFIFPCSGYLAIELKYSDENKLPKEEEESVIERVLYDLTQKIGMAVYVSTFIDANEIASQIEEEYLSVGEEDTVEVIETSSLHKASGLLNLYRQAKEIVNPEIAYLHYYKMIEHVSPAVAKKNAFASINNHLNLAASVPRDYNYMNTMLNIASQYRDDQKDDFLMQSVIQTCIDVKPTFHCLPENLQKLIKHNLNIDENADIETVALDPSQEKSLKRQVANILYVTRNSIVHAKANYVPSGLECTVEDLGGVNSMMDSIALTLIEWNEAQPDYLRV